MWQLTNVMYLLFSDILLKIIYFFQMAGKHIQTNMAGFISIPSFILSIKLSLPIASK